VSAAAAEAAAQQQYNDTQRQLEALEPPELLAHPLIHVYNDARNGRQASGVGRGGEGGKEGGGGGAETTTGDGSRDRHRLCVLSDMYKDDAVDVPVTPQHTPLLPSHGQGVWGGGAGWSGRVGDLRGRAMTHPLSTGLHHINIQTNTCKRTHTHAHINTNTHTHTHTHAHNFIGKWFEWHTTEVTI